MSERHEVKVKGKVVRIVPSKERANEVAAEYEAAGSKNVTTAKTK